MHKLQLLGTCVERVDNCLTLSVEISVLIFWNHCDYHLKVAFSRMSCICQFFENDNTIQENDKKKLFTWYTFLTLPIHTFHQHRRHIEIGCEWVASVMITLHHVPDRRLLSFYPISLVTVHLYRLFHINRPRFQHFRHSKDSNFLKRPKVEIELRSWE